MAGRDPGGFIPFLKVVATSPGYRRASHAARSLLLDMAVGAIGRNGKLSASRAYLEPLGWTSQAVVRNAVKELIACGLLHETRKGKRPNVSACYAVTWMDINDTRDLDPEAVATFPRGGYMHPEKPAPAPQKSRTMAATKARAVQAAARRNGYTLAPSNGAMKPSIAPSNGAMSDDIAPSNGAMKPVSAAPIAPLDGAFLEDAICTARRVPAAGTRLGRCLALRVKPGRQPEYWPARERILIERRRTPL